MTDGGEILVLGPENAGKSMLLRRLKEATTAEKDSHVDSTVPTVGMDVQRLDITGVEVTFREVGSAMSSRWETYVKGCSCLMYVVDISDSGALACSLVLLLELLVLPEMKGKYVLIVFNKADMATQSDFEHYYNGIDIDELKRTFDGHILLFGGSSLSRASAFHADEEKALCDELVSQLLSWFKTTYLPGRS